MSLDQNSYQSNRLLHYTTVMSNLFSLVGHFGKQLYY